MRSVSFYTRELVHVNTPILLKQGEMHLFTVCHTLESFGKEMAVLGGSPFAMIRASQCFGLPFCSRLYIMLLEKILRHCSPLLHDKQGSAPPA
jgi:hypothetical protein